MGLRKTAEPWAFLHQGLVGREGISQGDREDVIVGRREQHIVSRSFHERGVKKGRELSPVSYGFSDII